MARRVRNEITTGYVRAKQQPRARKGQRRGRGASRSYRLIESPRLWSSCALQLAIDPDAPASVRETLGNSLAGSLAWLADGQRIEGSLHFDGQPLAVDGFLVRRRGKAPVLSVEARGSLRGEPFAAALIGTLEGAAWGGRYTAVWGSRSQPLNGSFECSGLVTHELTPPPRPLIVASLWGPTKLIQQDGSKDADTEVTGEEDSATVKRLDKEGTPRGSSTTLKRDPGKGTQRPSGPSGPTITVYAGETNGTTVAWEHEVIPATHPGEKPQHHWVPSVSFWGRDVLITVKGCKKLKFFLFRESRSQIKGEKETAFPSTAKGGFEGPDEREAINLGNDYQGALEETGRTSSEDKAAERCPKDKPKKDSAGQPVPGETVPIADKDTFTVTHHLQLFICCDGTKLGYVEWTVKLQWTYEAKSGWTLPVASSTGAPDWHKPGDSPNSKLVNC